MRTYIFTTPLIADLTSAYILELQHIWFSSQNITHNRYQPHVDILANLYELYLPTNK